LVNNRNDTFYIYTQDVGISSFKKEQGIKISVMMLEASWEHGKFVLPFKR